MFAQRGADNPPSASITSPTNGATISGIIDVTADAADDNGVTQVEFFVGGVSIGVDTSPHYAASWDTITVADGLCTVTATATDTIAQTASDRINLHRSVP